MFTPKIWNDPPIVITVPREAIDSNDTESILNQLYPLMGDEQSVRASAGRLVLSFEGFGKSDGAIWWDEVWQAPESRSFVAMLDEKFPLWFFFVDLSGATLYTIAACVCRIEVREGQTIFNKQDLLDFSVRQFMAMDDLFEKYDFPKEEKSARQEQLTQYFAKVPVE